MIYSLDSSLGRIRSWVTTGSKKADSYGTILAETENERSGSAAQLQHHTKNRVTAIGLQRLYLIRRECEAAP